MDKLISQWKKFKKNAKSKGGDNLTGEEMLKLQLEDERKKVQRRNAEIKGAAPQMQNTSATQEEDGVTTHDSIPDSEGGAYQVSEVIKVVLPAGKHFDLKIEFLDSANSQNASLSWAIDSMLIDEDMLYLEDEEADKMYQELKQRSFRRRNMEEKENRLNIAMQAAAEEEDEDSSI